MPRKGPLGRDPTSRKEDVAVACWVVEELEEVLRLDQEATAEVPVTLKLPTEDLLTDLPGKQENQSLKPKKSSFLFQRPSVPSTDKA